MLELFRAQSTQYLDLRPPRVDVYQTEEEVIICGNPGVDKKNLDVYVDESTVKLGQFRQSDEFRDEHVYRANVAMAVFPRHSLAYRGQVR